MLIPWMSWCNIDKLLDNNVERRIMNEGERELKILDSGGCILLASLSRYGKLGALNGPIDNF
jgi:hypothetical protein